MTLVKYFCNTTIYLSAALLELLFSSNSVQCFTVAMHSVLQTCVNCSTAGNMVQQRFADLKSLAPDEHAETCCLQRLHSAKQYRCMAYHISTPYRHMLLAVIRDLWQQHTVLLLQAVP